MEPSAVASFSREVDLPDIGLDKELLQDKFMAAQPIWSVVLYTLALLGGTGLVLDVLRFLGFALLGTWGAELTKYICLITFGIGSGTIGVRNARKRLRSSTLTAA